MNILVDTSVWSLAFRKKEKTAKEQGIVNLLVEFTRDLKTRIIGPIRQEILSGFSDRIKFEKVRSSLAIYSDVKIDTKDYENAADYFNTCRRNGIQGSHIDFLICAVAVNNDLSIFTLDKDFENYQKYLSIKLI